jgi:hypothetical protein
VKTDEPEIGKDGEPYWRFYAADKPFPKTNAVWGADAYWDTYDWGPKWQRVPGCCRVVHADIPDPIPFYAPEWCGWRGVPTKSGEVYDYETGRHMRDYRSPFPAAPRTFEPFLKGKYKAKE